ncbi:hypothetical protein PtA15_15A190 [Puccinia triticina]|uniref:Uncharacterized protein n=1 Tax=Puccinia triticina TaxID=208348 RepID=A0ABY7D5C2_9BASI|nr:uncharacterized protein PtA15_15A190 [Puccinia triticina]WAQ91798.1 hypothetical protein PtA15_15A190 [Puccinia triticina]
MSGDNDQELLDAWMKCNELAQHTTWNPAQRAALIGLAKEIKVNFKNSDDEAGQPLQTRAPNQQTQPNSLAPTGQEPSRLAEGSSHPAQQPSCPAQGPTHLAKEPSCPAKKTSHLAKKTSHLAKEPSRPAQ